MKKWFLIFLLSSSALADTNVTWILPYIRPYLLMRGTNSHQYDTCWEFQNYPTNDVIATTYVLNTFIGDFGATKFLTTLNTNFTFVTSNHIAGRTYYYNTAYRVIDPQKQSEYWITNGSEILIQQTNAVNTNTPVAPKGLLIFEHW